MEYPGVEMRALFELVAKSTKEKDTSGFYNMNKY